MALTQQAAKDHVCKHTERIYRALSEGKDSSLSQRLHLEGQINLLLDVQLIEFTWLEALINQYHERWIGEAINPLFWQWMKGDNCFYLPVQMADAPVYKK